VQCNYAETALVARRTTMTREHACRGVLKASVSEAGNGATPRPWKGLMKRIFLQTQETTSGSLPTPQLVALH